MGRTIKIVLSLSCRSGAKTGGTCTRKAFCRAAMVRRCACRAEGKQARDGRRKGWKDYE